MCSQIARSHLNSRSFSSHRHRAPLISEASNGSELVPKVAIELSHLIPLASPLLIQPSSSLSVVSSIRVVVVVIIVVDVVLSNAQHLSAPQSLHFYLSIHLSIYLCKFLRAGSNHEPLPVHLAAYVCMFVCLSLSFSLSRSLSILRVSHCLRFNSSPLLSRQFLLSSG